MQDHGTNGDWFSLVHVPSTGVPPQSYHSPTADNGGDNYNTRIQTGQAPTGSASRSAPLWYTKWMFFGPMLAGAVAQAGIGMQCAT